MYKIDVMLIERDGKCGECYAVRILDRDTDEEYMRFIWMGARDDALIAGFNALSAYVRGRYDGSQETMGRVLDMVEQLGGIKE